MKVVLKKIFNKIRYAAKAPFDYLSGIKFEIDAWKSLKKEAARGIITEEDARDLWAMTCTTGGPMNLPAMRYYARHPMSASAKEGANEQHPPEMTAINADGESNSAKKEA
jgi:hypothetical protein